MNKNFSMPEEVPVVGLLPSAADAAGRTSVYRSLKFAHRAWLICRVNQGNAAQVTFTPLQAQDVSGTGSKAIGATPIFVNSNTALSDLLTKQGSSAANFQTDAGTNDKYVIFDIIPEDVLDVANGFRTIAVQTSASNAANITSAELQYTGRFQALQPPTTFNS